MWTTRLPGLEQQERTPGAPQVMWRSLSRLPRHMGSQLERRRGSRRWTGAHTRSIHIAQRGPQHLCRAHPRAPRGSRRTPSRLDRAPRGSRCLSTTWRGITAAPRPACPQGRRRHAHSLPGLSRATLRLTPLRPSLVLRSRTRQSCLSPVLRLFRMRQSCLFPVLRLSRMRQSCLPNTTLRPLRPWPFLLWLVHASERAMRTMRHPVRTRQHKGTRKRTQARQSRVPRRILVVWQLRGPTIARPGASQRQPVGRWGRGWKGSNPSLPFLTAVPRRTKPEDLPRRCRRGRVLTSAGQSRQTRRHCRTDGQQHPQVRLRLTSRLRLAAGRPVRLHPQRPSPPPLAPSTRPPQRGKVPLPGPPRAGCRRWPLMRVIPAPSLTAWDRHRACR